MHINMPVAYGDGDGTVVLFLEDGDGVLLDLVTLDLAQAPSDSLLALIEACHDVLAGRQTAR